MSRGRFGTIIVMILSLLCALRCGWRASIGRLPSPAAWVRRDWVGLAG